MTWITVYRTFSPADAELAKSRLEAAGLQVFIADELSALSMEGYSMTTGGIRVQVPDDVVEEAKLLLADKDRPQP